MSENDILKIEFLQVNDLMLKTESLMEMFYLASIYIYMYAYVKVL